jgi:hypothetical protein
VTQPENCATAKCPIESAPMGGGRPAIHAGRVLTIF